MLTRALDAGVPARWVAGDEVYGADPVLRAELENHRVGYVLAVGCEVISPGCAAVSDQRMQPTCGTSGRSHARSAVRS